MATLGSLILLQLFWSSSYVAMKFALVSMPVGLVMILRYGIAALLLLAVVRFRPLRNASMRDWLLIVGVGIVTFTLSPYLQLKSLTMTQAVDVAVLVSLEPLITALAATLFLKERLTWDLALVLLIATAGVLIMSGFHSIGRAASGERLLGNLLFLAALGFEACCSVAGRVLTQSHPPLQLAAWMFLVGSAVSLLFNLGTLEAIPSFSAAPASWIAVLYMAVFGSAVGYGGCYLLVKKVPVSRLALSLFLQPVIGSLLGYYLMGERLDSQTLVGGGLIVVTLFLWVLNRLRKRI